MTNIPKRAEAEINLASIEHNFREIKKFTENKKIICVIKANAYGHGAVRLGRLYEALGADILAVACLDEALELRDAGIRMPVMILGVTPPRLAGVLADNRIIQSVPGLDYAVQLERELTSENKKLEVHIKVDTGMTRFGIYAHGGYIDSAADEAEKIASLPHLAAEGIFTHFAEAENEDTSFTEEQLASFLGVVKKLENRGKTFAFCHCANSAAVVNYKKAHLSCVRPGLLLYGLSPTGKSVPGLSIRPAMTFKSLVADIRHIRKGDSVSYNRRFVAQRDMKIAVISCGYADGLHRSLSGKAQCLIRGRRAQMLGNICMDLFLADVSEIPDVKHFDEAVIFGSQNGEYISPDELACLSGTISYELLTSVSKRVPRTYDTSPA
ncbi:MAG: alanine racemase [Clostridia bacterium]|nr:alanine racemase [Oscillospiraceae bacterium]MBQ8758771.1 alanine racemase [Clostridia bacterium]